MSVLIKDNVSVDNLRNYRNYYLLYLQQTLKKS